MRVKTEAKFLEIAKALARKEEKIMKRELAKTGMVASGNSSVSSSSTTTATHTSMKEKDAGGAGGGMKGLLKGLPPPPPLLLKQQKKLALKNPSPMVRRKAKNYFEEIDEDSP